MGCGVFTRPVRGVYGDLSAVCEQDHQLFVPAGSASGVIDVARGYLFTVVPFYLVVCTKFVCDSVLRGAGAMRPFMVTTFPT